MNRRQMVATVAGVGLTGGGIWAATRSRGGAVGELPVSVRTIDAPGSERGETQVPVPSTPTVVDLFATWCAPCEEQMEALRAVNAAYGDRVRFVSVTNERVGNTLSTDDIRAWWREHDGDWTVGLDPDSDLMSALRADGLPYLAVTDATGRVRWTHGGTADAATLRDRIDRVLADG